MASSCPLCMLLLVLLASSASTALRPKMASSVFIKAVKRILQSLFHFIESKALLPRHIDR